jgi:phosphatidate cytidylyltransferase
VNINIGIDGLAAGELAESIATSRFRVRLAAAAILMPLTIGLTWLGQWPFALMLMAFAALIAREWARICGALPGHQTAWLLAVGALAIMAGAKITGNFVGGIIASAVLALLLVALHRRVLDRTSCWWFASGAVLITVCGISLIWLRATVPHGLFLTLWLFAVVWATDSGAFAIGRTLGGPRLAPRISPRKTWSGFLGGLLAAAVTSAAIGIVLRGDMAVAAAAGTLVSFAAQMGDLAESRMKRRFDVKDSGGLIPGHGGVLDRLDSLLAAAPITAGLYLAGWRWL